jgi:peptidoglycan hydrolase-like protein with peptidoglycan-binding domain
MNEKISQKFVSPIDNLSLMCPGFSTYLTFGSSATEVKLWQAFLNKYNNEQIPLTGYFGPKTQAAVKRFQLKYKDQILTPWKITTPTGRIYQSTRFQANKLIGCTEGRVTLDNGTVVK